MCVYVCVRPRKRRPSVNEPLSSTDITHTAALTDIMRVSVSDDARPVKQTHKRKLNDDTDSDDDDDDDDDDDSEVRLS